MLFRCECCASESVVGTRPVDGGDAFGCWGGGVGETVCEGLGGFGLSGFGGEGFGAGGWRGRGGGGCE